MSLAVLRFSLLLGFTACSVHDVPEPVVAAPTGTFRGKILAAPSGATFASYRGIPYALPPTGDRRFALPEAFPKIEVSFLVTMWVCPAAVKDRLDLVSPVLVTR